jgi:SAM-dependent methyltransferase
MRVDLEPGQQQPLARRVFASQAYERHRLKRIAELCRGRSLLDLGYAQQPNPYYRGVHRVGLDLRRPSSPSGYEEEIVGDALDLTPYLGSRRFDTIVAAELIEHLERPYDFLRGLGNFLSDDGRIVLSTPNPVSWPVALFEVMRSSKYFYSRDHVYYFTPRWMNRMLERCGFTVDAVISVGLLLPLPGIVLPCPVGLSYHVIYVARSTPV